ncbi:FAD-binding oxidoreductase [Microbacterium thalassium]|uniref:FAD/FMN-containing dehydrogenase n=1 Tax=Microbacterium thalassium TaxID=362649 RepID=A0A7X0FS14_9MICO|nr:FAD-binding oxidoreductase [Microbacterium thalassium]MBB6392668.1 FAD/FMN-containing dehydrogenase [Microbacterium thalassium]GLK23101.1 FAD-linked oxidase [Microbacterium thalassium]
MTINTGTTTGVTAAAATADRLREVLGDRVVLAGDAAYDAARVPWNLAIDQRPFAVVHPESAEDVVDVVRAARALGLRVAPQSTGHGAGALADTDLSDAILVSLSKLRGVTVHPEAQSARVLGGSEWNDVVQAAAPWGLTALHGSSGDVGVVGYALSGGLSFYARAHGLAVNSVRAVQIVTADGRIVRASVHDDPELFWAVRGGSGAFGVVVSLEIDLLPIADVFAGMLLWPVDRAPEVVAAWSSWTTTAPESASTSLRVMHFPPMPDLPPFLSDRSVVVIDGAILETDAAATALLEPLRALTPEIDTFARIPAVQLVQVHMDPPEPTPGLTAGAMLSGFAGPAVDAYVAAATTTPGLFLAELRHVGGAAARRPDGAGAIGSVQGDFLLAGIAMVPAPELAESALAAAHGMVAAMADWHAPALALTFIDGGVDRTLGFGAAQDRLRELKAVYDPANMFAGGQPVG